MKIFLNTKVCMKSFSWLFVLCIVLSGCNDKTTGLGNNSLSFDVDSMVVLDDVRVEFLQIELTEPLTEACNIYITSSIEESKRFSFPEYIRLGEGAIRGKYPIYVTENKFSSLDVTTIFTFDKVAGPAEIDATKKSIKFTIKGKANAGAVVIGFEDNFYSVGEDEEYFELPFKIQGVLEDSVKLKVKALNGTAVVGTDFWFGAGNKNSNSEGYVQLTKGEEWNFIPISILDDGTSALDRTFTITLESLHPVDELVNIAPTQNECVVTIRNVERRLRVTDSLVEVGEYIGKINYNFNLTATVPATVTADIVVDEKSTAIEGKHFRFILEDGQTKPTIEIAPGETSSGIKIEILDESLGNEDRKLFLKIINAKGVEVSAKYGIGEVIIQNDDNSVGFASSEAITPSGEVIKIPISVVGTLDEELQFVFEVVDGEGNATSPNDFIILSPIEPKVIEGQSTAYLSVSTTFTSKSKNFLLKLVKIKGTGISINSVIDQNRRYCKVNMLGVIDKTQWKIIDSSVSMDSDPVGKLIDGDITTFWHSRYTDATSAAPWFFVIDMTETLPINKILLNARKDQQDSRLIAIYLSDSPLDKDSPDWVEILNYRFPTAPYAPNQTLTIPGEHTGRYMMLKILEGRPGDPKVAAFCEITVNPKD